MEPSKTQTLPCARRALSRSSCGFSEKLSVDFLPPSLAGGPFDTPRPSTSPVPPLNPAPQHEGPPSDAEIVKEKLSKLLLGEEDGGAGPEQREEDGVAGRSSGRLLLSPFSERLLEVLQVV